MTANRTEMAEIFGVALTTLDAWCREGCPHARDGRNLVFEVGPAVQWALARERERAKPAAREGEISYNEAIRRKAVADALKAELAFAESKKLVAPIDMIAKVVSDEIANARGRLLAIPTKFRPEAQVCAATEDKAKRLVAKVNDLIFDALTEIKTYGASR